MLWASSLRARICASSAWVGYSPSSPRRGLSTVSHKAMDDVRRSYVGSGEDSRLSAPLISRRLADLVIGHRQSWNRPRWLWSVCSGPVRGHTD